jgi:hypothetical protein
MNAFKSGALALSVLVLSGCVGPQTRNARSVSGTGPATSARTVSALDPYLAVLSGVAPGDASRRQATAESARTQSEIEPSASHRLAYALAIGSAGSAESNPVEARSIIVELLAAPNALTQDEKTLAEAFQREFDARAALHEELTRQRVESSTMVESIEMDAKQRSDALAAENARLRKALADADRKLKAVAEMERQLLRHGGDSAEPSSAPP